MNHTAIYNTHSNVVYIEDADTGVIAKDVSGNVVELDAAAVEAETTVVETAWNFQSLRRKRNQLLAETDWTANSDVVMTEEMRTYRQALRDLPANTADPVNPTWPEL
jgi:glucosamine 6-phosphate synthetase-like amidotransferase/phosphosugar isomerase protein